MRCSHDGLGHEVFGVRTADGEPEVVVAVVDDTLADDAVALLQRRHAAPDLRDLARPLVARDDRIRDRDDVSALVELEVRVADADVPRAHEHLVRRDRGHIDVADHRAFRFFEHQRFHPNRSLLVDQYLDLVRRSRGKPGEGIWRFIECDVARDDAFHG